MRSLNRVVALIAGALLLALGVAGFVVSAGIGFSQAPGVPLLGVLNTNPLQAVVHGIVGAGLVLTGLLGMRPARAGNTAAGTLFLLLGLAGLFVVGTPYDVLALSGAGNVLHLVAATVLLAVGLGAERPG
ncbi:MAG: DUF4383 domain-containing protein [Schumannella sp.]|nr:DUF4383 domain-containing protein [Microbacteriaceae bacterium]